MTRFDLRQAQLFNQLLAFKEDYKVGGRIKHQRFLSRHKKLCAPTNIFIWSIFLRDIRFFLNIFRERQEVTSVEITRKLIAICGIMNVSLHF